MDEERLEDNAKRKRDKVVRGQRKHQKEDAIRVDTQEHLPSKQVQTQRLDGFYYEDWGENQQDADDWQVPDTWCFVAEYQI